jgi:hypothetical protein
LRFVVVASLLAGLSTTAAAEKFLGVEGQGGDAAADGDAKGKGKKDRAADDDREEGGDTFDNVSLSGAFGLGPSYVDGEVTVGIALNHYVWIETTYSYYRFDQGEMHGQQYGPEVDLVLRFPNKTMLTPYIGAGPGYVKWQRVYQSNAFDDGASPTAAAFGGVQVRLTRHFGLQLERRELQWLGDPPKSFDDRATPEARTSFVTTLDFRVMF